jgi:hypothetical protein
MVLDDLSPHAKLASETRDSFYPNEGPNSAIAVDEGGDDDSGED